MYPTTQYRGERETFGEDGWKTAYKFLEAGSDFAIDLIDPNLRKGPQFNKIAFSHYFLNQSGLGPLDEANFHAFALRKNACIIIVKPTRNKKPNF